MEIQIKQMREEHLKDILPIEAELFTEPWQTEFFNFEIKQGDSIVAYNEGKLVGYVCGFAVLDEFSISNVGVSKRIQRHGVAYKMLKHLIDKKISDGTIVFYLEVRESNISAINLYRKLGFGTIGKRRNYYKHPLEDAIVMKYEHQ